MLKQLITWDIFLQIPALILLSSHVIIKDQNLQRDVIAYDPFLIQRKL